MTTSFDDPDLPLDLVFTNTQLILAVGTYEWPLVFCRTSRESLWRSWGSLVCGRRRGWWFFVAELEAYQLEIEQTWRSESSMNVSACSCCSTGRWDGADGADWAAPEICSGAVDLHVEPLDLGAEVRESTLHVANEAQRPIHLFISTFSTTPLNLSRGQWVFPHEFDLVSIGVFAVALGRTIYCA